MTTTKITHLEQYHTIEQSLELTPCATCRYPIAVLESHIAHVRKVGGSVFCPLGHSSTWRESAKSKMDQLEKKLARLESAKDRAETQAQYAHQRAEKEKRSASAHKGHLTRHKKRAKNGVCPCCSRTFKQLARHMETQHPDYCVDVVSSTGASDD